VIAFRSDPTGETLVKYNDLIENASKKHNINPDIVRAICIVESGLDTWAVRYEAGWRWWLSPIKWGKRVGVTTRTERVCQQMSWGLMQIMGTVARERGFKGDIPNLCQPDVGLEFGCKHLRWLLDRHKSLDRALSAYNTGRPDTRAGRDYTHEVMLVMEGKSWIS